MADIIIDLSGKTGLADNFFGDADTITPRPELRLSTEGGGLAAGLFNPYLRTGYLAPVTTTNADLTLDTPTTTQLSSVEFDYDNGQVYWGDTLNSIYVGTSLTDTSLALEASLIVNAANKFEILSDLQIYELNGVTKLFYSGVGTLVHSGVASSGFPEVKLATIPAANDSAWVSVAVNSNGTAQPSILEDIRDFQAGSSTTITSSITVPSGTDTALVVLVFNSSGQTVSSVTYNSVAMDVQAGSTGAASGVYAYELASPDTGTHDIVVTYSGAASNRLVYGVVLDNVDQTILTRPITDVATADTTIIANKKIISSAQLTLYAAYSDEVLTFINPKATALYNTTNSYGSDGLFVETDSGMYLQVGYADLPLTSVTQAQESWISGTATGGGLEIVYTDYAFMRIADNGFAYIFADNKVHKIDGTTLGGTNGVLTRNVLLFPELFKITDALDYRSRLFIAVHHYPVSVSDTTLNTFSGKCGLYVWNRVSTKLSSADYIELPGVREIKKIFASPDGQLRLIVIADSGLTELRQFGYNDSGGVVFPVIKTLGIGAYPQFPDGLATAGDKVMWLANDGKMYCNKDKYVTQIYQAKAPGTTTATLESNIVTGAIFYGSGNETGDAGYRSNKQAVTFSYLDGATHNVEKIYPFDLKTGPNATQASAQGDVYSGVALIPQHSVVRNVRVYNAPVSGTGTTVIATVKLYFNQSSTVGMTKTITKDEAKRGYVDFQINKPYIHAVQVKIEWSTSITLDGDIYLPSVAIISHEPTKAKSPDNG